RFARSRQLRRWPCPGGRSPPPPPALGKNTPARRGPRAPLRRPTKSVLIPAISIAGTNARLARCRLKIENNAHWLGPILRRPGCADKQHPAARFWSSKEHV